MADCADCAEFRFSGEVSGGWCGGVCLHRIPRKWCLFFPLCVHVKRQESRVASKQKTDSSWVVVEGSQRARKVRFAPLAQFQPVLILARNEGRFCDGTLW